MKSFAHERSGALIKPAKLEDDEFRNLSFKCSCKKNPNSSPPPSLVLSLKDSKVFNYG
jgi:hypothetical protein